MKRGLEANAARALRVEMYADWLEHDADGLAWNLAHPAGKPIENATVILATARERIALALARIDQAIAADKKSHREQEPA